MKPFLHQLEFFVEPIPSTFHSQRSPDLGADLHRGVGVAARADRRLRRCRCRGGAFHVSHNFIQL